MRRTLSTFFPMAVTGQTLGFPYEKKYLAWDVLDRPKQSHIEVCLGLLYSIAGPVIGRLEFCPVSVSSRGA